MRDVGDGPPAARRVTSGVIAGTAVETETGWLPVEALRPGQKICTLRRGVRELRAIFHSGFGPDLEDVYPEGITLVPAGLIGNTESFYVLPDQHIMLRGPEVASLTGEPMVLVSGRDIVGYGGIGAVLPVDGIDVYSLVFDQEDVVFASTGVMMHCPRPTRTIDTVSDAFPVMGPQAAGYLMSCRCEAPSPVASQEPVIA